ncbi:17355_t:CDS:2, partial [Gigaspora rosea]
NVQLLAKQLERAIDILEIALPDTMLVFGFDNSKQPKMRPSRFSDGIPQEIVFPLNHRNEKKRGQPKGITEVLTERGIWNKKLRG